MSDMAAGPRPFTRQKPRCMRAGRRWLLISIAIVVSLAVAGTVKAADQQFPQVPLYELLPVGGP